MRLGWTIALILAAGPALADDLVGRTVPPYPNGLESLIGSCVGDTEAGEDICAWSIATINRESGEAVGLYAARTAGNQADGAPLWQVTSELPIPAIGSGYDVVIGECRNAEVPDQTIAAIARPNPDGEYSDEVAWAAQLDRGTGALTAIDAATVDCLFPGT